MKTYLFMITSRLILRRMKKRFRQKLQGRSKHTLYVLLLLPGTRAVYEMWKNMVQPYRPQMAIKIRRIHFACWITKTTDTHSEYVILNAFPLQQWLQERASMLRDTYTAIKNHIRYHVLLFTYIFNYLFLVYLIPLSVAQTTMAYSGVAG